MNKSRQPAALARDKEFEKRVKDDWEKTASGIMDMEHPMKLSLQRPRGTRVRRGRVDIFVDELGDFVSIVEIKATNWDRIKPANVTKNLGSHRRQIWKYVYEYTAVTKTDVCAGVIDPKSPETEGLKERVEDYMSDYGIAVVWYAD